MKYYKKYKVKNKARFLRETVMYAVLKKFDEGEDDNDGGAQTDVEYYDLEEMISAEDYKIPEEDYENNVSYIREMYANSVKMKDKGQKIKKE